MSTVYSDRESAARARAGCPPVLATDVSHSDVGEPPVEWPPGPPSRPRGRHTSARPTDRVIDVTDAVQHEAVLDEDPMDDAAPVAQLTAGRALRLLDAAMDHMRTVLETSTDATASAQVERAIGDVGRATEALRAVADGPHDDVVA